MFYHNDLFYASFFIKENGLPWERSPLLQKYYFFRSLYIEEKYSCFCFNPPPIKTDKKRKQEE
ncbi:hypothetical protein D0T51_03910 [Parabacteroides sp. 52]|nr:hypothetical protein [Parabacteroides sp. 52]